MKLECQAEPDANHLNFSSLHRNKPFLTALPDWAGRAKK
jgi:hypothetical protein